jgi:lipopolysaccharide biosynthesis glycosyltransferase
VEREQFERHAKTVTADNLATNKPRYKIAIVYVCDANYHDLTLYSLASIARSHHAPLDFFFMQSEYQGPVPDGLLKMITAGRHSLVVRNAPPLNVNVALSSNQERYSHISAAMFLKASAIDSLASAYDYILYIDGDTLAFDDLHCERIAGFTQLAAACLDLSSASGFDDPNFFSNCEFSGASPEFFNSGVMMINSKKWIETSAGARFLENLFVHEKQCPYFTRCLPNDQCAFNMTLGSDLKLLPVPWNVQQSALHTHAWETALIRHYTGPDKFLPIRPWRCDRREYSLIREISSECKLSLPCKFYDSSLSYELNRIRRRKTISKYEHAIRTTIASRLVKHGRLSSP